MLELQTLAETSAALLNRKTPTLVMRGMSEAFDAALFDYHFDMFDSPDVIPNKWRDASFFMTRESAVDPSPAFKIRAASHYVAMSYILCGHAIADITMRNPPNANIREPVADELANYFLEISDTAKCIQRFIDSKHFNHGLDKSSIQALGEFYKLSIFALQEIGPYLPKKILGNCNIANANLIHDVGRYGLQEHAGLQGDAFHFGLAGLIVHHGDWKKAGADILWPPTKPLHPARPAGEAVILDLAAKRNARALANAIKKLQH